MKTLNKNAEMYLNILTTLLNSDNPEDHKKSIRDMLDNFEGHYNQAYNRNGKYDHNSLKCNTRFISKKAQRIKSTRTKKEFTSETHREHAKPVSIIISEAKGMNSKELLSYLDKNLLSVTIMKAEAHLLDRGAYKISMPDTNNILSRFEICNIKVVENL